MTLEKKSSYKMADLLENFIGSLSGIADNLEKERSQQRDDYFNHLKTGQPKKNSKKKTIKGPKYSRKNEETFQKLILENIVYGCLTRAKLEKMSVCNVTKQLNKKRLDKTNTSDDLRMGCLENDGACLSCGKGNDECPGHYGIINLPNKYIHPMFREETIKVLQSICWRCYDPLINSEILAELKLAGIPRLTYIAELSKKINHTDCLHRNKLYKYTKNPTFKTGTGPRTSKGKVVATPTSSVRDGVEIYTKIVVGSGEAKTEKDLLISPETVYGIFSKITPQNVKLLGFEGYLENGNWVWKNHPLNFIVDFIPVIPPYARPYVIRSGVKKYDFITRFYDDIIDQIDKLTNEAGAPEDCIKNILFFYSHIIDNGDKLYKKSAQDIIRSFKDRLVGKEQLIRGSIMGKRSDYTGRTVLGPNRDIEFGEVAPPSFMRRTLTIPEHVTKYNIEKIHEMAKKGEISCLTPKLGKLAGRKLRFKVDKHKIQLGDIVERFSMDGDVIIFNRQPTLQKQSMCGYKVKFQDKLSVGIHITSTTGHNADFDGDEGNIHMIQSIEARVEARTFMASNFCIMSGINSSPVGGVIYNGATGGYLLSCDKVLLSKSIFAKGLASMKYSKFGTIKDRIISLGRGINPLSGKVLCSCLFPEDFWYTNGGLMVRKGVLIKGRLSKKNMGPSPNSIIQSIYKNYGQEEARRFITDATFLFNWYLGIYGFTVGIKDCRPPAEKEEEFNNTKEAIINEINEDVINLPPLLSPTSDRERMEREEKINELITTGTDRIKMKLVGGETEENGEKIKIESILADDNAISLMATSGAKGKVNDTAKIIALLGQQYVPDRRPDCVVSRKKRWLSSFHVDDKSIFSRGFVAGSFFKGLDPDEFYAHSMASRIGLSNTAVKTADIGALQRKMVKSQEDLIAQYDGSVRNQNGNIYQFSYGAGLGSSKLLRRTKKNSSNYLTFINLEETIGKINTEEGFMTENYVFDEVSKMF